MAVLGLFRPSKEGGANQQVDGEMPVVVGGVQSSAGRL
jgi:hypothetical protein